MTKTTQNENPINVKGRNSLKFQPLRIDLSVTRNSAGTSTPFRLKMEQTQFLPEHYMNKSGHQALKSVIHNPQNQIIHPNAPTVVAPQNSVLKLTAGTVSEN